MQNGLKMAVYWVLYADLKAKATLMHSINTQRGSRVIALLFP
jgi:hypothetical protein